MEHPQFVNQDRWKGIIKPGEQEIEPKNNLEVYRKMGKQIGTPEPDSKEVQDNSPFRIRD